MLSKVLTVTTKAFQSLLGEFLFLFSNLVIILPEILKNSNSFETINQKKRKMPIFSIDAASLHTNNFMS